MHRVSAPPSFWRTAISALMFIAVGCVCASELPLALQGSGPYYRLALPPEVFPHSRHADLRDLQVLNGSGVPVPFAWLPGELASEQVFSKRLPVFALPSVQTGQESVAPALSFRLAPDGHLQLAGSRATGTSASATDDWILDASTVAGAMMQLRLELAPGVTGFFPFTLQASDDLQQWRPVNARGPLARLETQGTQIERLAVDLHGLHARYLRLTFQTPSTKPLLQAVHVDGVQRADSAPLLLWSKPILPTRCDALFCEYSLAPNTPIDSLRIHLAQINTLAPVTVYGMRPAASAPAHVHRNPLYVLRHKREKSNTASDANLHWMASTTAYRLAAAQDSTADEVVSPDVPMGSQVYASLRLVMQSPVERLGTTPPAIAVGIYPRPLVFLAQGAGPFRLAWSSDSKSAMLPLKTLIPGYRSGHPVTADEARLEVRAVAPAPDKPATPPAADAERSKPTWLWATLGLALLLLVGMAWSLLRSMRQST